MFSSITVFYETWVCGTIRCVSVGELRPGEEIHGSIRLKVTRAKRASWKALGLLLYRVGLLSVWSTFALPGVILNGPIFLTASILSKKKAKGTRVSLRISLALLHAIPEALAASVVKIHGRDVVASWKVLISLGITPVLYSFYATVATIIAIKANAPWQWRLLTPPLTITALPAIGYAALKFGEAGSDVLK